MQKLWRKLKEKASSCGGATVVEVTVLIPFILLLTAGSVIFGIFMLDMAQTKGWTMEKVNQREEVTPEERSMLSKQLHLARLTECTPKKDLTQNNIHAVISADQLWRGLGEFMMTSYEFRTDTCAVSDRRKELRWMAK